ncbi:MAG: DUF2892 domain-containing protein [Sulfuricella sp.]|nr:DUF2892 domain-containing protein [Sulfuricella sp.]
MKCNVGGIDRVGRIVVGIVLLLVGILMPSLETTVRIIILAVAAIALITAVVRFCPANGLLGIDTCDKE